MLDPRHSARYDANGNIILPAPGETAEASVGADEWSRPLAWESMTGMAMSSEDDERDEPVIHLERVRHHLRIISEGTRSAFQEGMQQYAVSFAAAGPGFVRLEQETTGALARLKEFLFQPVWVPSRRKKARCYNRATLFVLDIFRFGATFGGIFALLFVALNYQSFWQIFQARVGSVAAGPSIESFSAPREDVPGNRPDASAGIGGGERAPGDLLGFLPPAGPPDNRIIIPKLGLNVPLVSPSTAALLREDWPQVEKDIQSALQQGVVHYPGTARPGQAGNFFVTGHSSYYPWDPGNFKTVFARLHELEPGDEFLVYYQGDRHRYVVRSEKEVSPSDVTVLDQPTDKRIATIMTCTPVGTTLRRLIVVAQEVDPATGEPLKVGQKTSEPLKSVPLEALPI